MAFTFSIGNRHPSLAFVEFIKSSLTGQRDINHPINGRKMLCKITLLI